MNELLNEHFTVQRAFTYLFVGTEACLIALTLLTLYLLAKQGQVQRNMTRKCEKMQKQIAQNAVLLGQVLKALDMDRQQQAPTLKVSNKNAQRNAVPDTSEGMYAALMRMQDKIDAQDREIRELRKQDQRGWKDQA